MANIQNRRYWAIRTDRDNKPLLFSELREGRLRQGWGYDLSQDLRLIQGEIVQGGNWWERLSETQKEVLPHLRMLSEAEDSIQVGNIILVPNLPDDGFFVVLEVIGDYYFDPINLSSEQDYNELNKDYGHVLPVRLIIDKGINKYADSVDASIRSTFRTPMRMWNLDNYQSVIERLIKDYQEGKDLSTSTSGEARLNRAWETALSHARGVLHEKLGLELDTRFQAAEWEEPIKFVLENLYPRASIRWVGGPQEYGADVIVQIQNHFGDLPWLILVQVKNYTGEIGPSVLKQLRTAYDRYSKEGQILSLVVMTTANKAASDFIDGAHTLSEEFNVPVEIVLRKDMMKILSDGLMTKLT
jgi:hypothetical protein